MFSKMFGGKSEPPKRVRICVECGMPIAEHKNWCSILRGQQEMAERAAAQRPSEASE
jgi:hypothetical protein